MSLPILSTLNLFVSPPSLYQGGNMAFVFQAFLDNEKIWCVFDLHKCYYQSDVRAESGLMAKKDKI